MNNTKKIEQIEQILRAKKEGTLDVILASKLNDIKEEITEIFNAPAKTLASVNKIDKVLSEIGEAYKQIEEQIEELYNQDNKLYKDKTYSDDYFKKELQTLKNVIADVRAKKVDRIIEKTEVIKEVPNPIDTDKIALEASKQALEATNKLIQAIPPITNDLPKYGGIYRDALETLKDEDRLDASAIKNLPEFISGNKGVSPIGFRPSIDGEKLGMIQRLDLVSGEDIDLIHSKVNGLDTVTFDNTSTLQTVTDRGATTDNIIDVPAITHQTDYTPTGSEPIGTRYWNQAKRTTTLKTSSTSELDDGQEVRFNVKARGDILNGQVVQFAGYQGDHYTAKVVVPAEVIANSKLLMGIATEDIANGSFGNITCFGEVSMNTTGWSVDDLIYWDNVTGQLTNVHPDAPERYILIGVVVKEETSPASANGILLIRISWGQRLDELEDVDGTDPTTTGDLLSYNETSEVWDRGVYNINDYVPYTGATADVNLGSNNFTVDTNTLFVDAVNNRVGIGTTPASILHINDVNTGNDGVYIEKTSGINKTALDVNHKSSVSTRSIAKFRSLAGTAFEALADGTLNAPIGNIYFGSGFSGQTTGKINIDFGANGVGTAMSLKGNAPAIVQTIHRTIGTSSAVPLSRVQYTNDVTTNQQIAEFGILADNNIGGTPVLRYMYMNPFATSSAWDGATLKVDFENRVGIGLAGTTRPTEKLEIDGNLFLNGDNDKIYLGADKDEYLEYDPTLDGIQTAGKFKASEVRAIHKASDGTAPVADGTYTVGIGGTTNGTITIKDGIITAVQEAVA